MLPHVFDLFAQVDHTERAYGSTFTVRLPLLSGQA